MQSMICSLSAVLVAHGVALDRRRRGLMIHRPFLYLLTEYEKGL